MFGAVAEVSLLLNFRSPLILLYCSHLKHFFTSLYQFKDPCKSHPPRVSKCTFDTSSLITLKILKTQTLDTNWVLYLIQDIPRTLTQFSFLRYIRGLAFACVFVLQVSLRQRRVQYSTSFFERSIQLLSTTGIFCRFKKKIQYY